MLEQETENTTEQVEEVQTEETQETQTEETQETQTEEHKESIVDKIGSMISAAKDRLTGGGDDADADIPDDFTDAMQTAGYSDEDIVKFVDEGNNGKPFTDEQLLEMIPSLTRADSAKAEESAETAAETAGSTKEEKAEDSQEDEKLQPLLDRIASLEAERDSRNEVSEEQERDSFVSKASDLFDKASEEFEVFGKTDDLPRFPDGRPIPTSPQMKARNEVFGSAAKLKQAGYANDEALEVALNAYKGKHLATEIGRKTIRDLKKREQKLSGKRVSHGAVGGDKGKLSGADVIGEVARRHGHDIPD